MKNLFRIALAYSVHLFTASGLIFALLAMWSISIGNTKMYFVYLTITVFIDALDGTLARKFEVKKYTPNIDGALLDNMIDYITFVFLPAYFVFASGIVENPYAIIAGSLILIGSSYQFIQSNAKVDAEDHFFTGFPSYWNMLVLYLFWWQTGNITNFVIIVFLTLMIFVPIKYIYPSRTKAFMKFTASLMLVYSVSIFYEVLFRFENPHTWFMYFSAFVFIYYTLASFYLNFRPKHKSQSQPASQPASLQSQDYNTLNQKTNN